MMHLYVMLLACFRLFFLSCFFAHSMFSSALAQTAPLRLGIAGLSHAHVHGLLGRKERGDIVITGIAEPNLALAAQYAKQYGFSMEKVYPTLEAMVEATKPEAVAAFGSIYAHLEVVQVCAPKGIHVMVEKPLAVNMSHARKMNALAKKHKIHLLTNYETTWYPSTHKAAALLHAGTVGNLRRLIVYDGHRGPKKIGVDPAFLAWLTDPVENGGGAITDFGCYGANIAAWLLKGVKPNTVTAVTQQLQPQHNPKVDDEATIILTYDSITVLLQPSWNWPMGRKDMELYGLTGAIYADNATQLRVRYAEGYDGYREEKFTLPALPAPTDDAFALFAAVIRGSVILPPWDLSALDNNMQVVEILDAAKKSARKGNTVKMR